MTILAILAIPLLLVSVVCSIIVLIDAFQNEVWKGLLFFFCSLYALYYTFVEFDSDKKVLILAGIFGGSILGWTLLGASGVMAH